MEKLHFWEGGARKICGFGLFKKRLAIPDEEVGGGTMLAQRAMSED